MDTYLINSSLTLSPFYIVYRFFLYNNVSHQIKRFSGLAIVLFVLVFEFTPTIELQSSSDYPINFEAIVNGTSSLVPDPENLSVSLLNVFTLIYFIGVGFFTLRFGYNVFSILYFVFKSTIRKMWGFKVVEMEKLLSPFSFFNYLFISKSIEQDENVDLIIVHEQYHRNHLHSLDIIFLELISILFWFNPFMWLFKRDIQSSHEYMADQHVIGTGCDRFAYQNLLFKTRTGISFSSANYLNNQTGIKQRINKMKESKSSRKNGILAISFLMLTMFAITVFSSFSFPVFPNHSSDFDFRIYDESGPIYPSTGVSRETKKLFFRIIPKEDDEYLAYRIHKVEATLISGDVGITAVTTGETLELQPLLSNLSENASLVLAVKAYQAQNKKYQVSEFTLEEPIMVTLKIN